jgi:hypothetical protein
MDGTKLSKESYLKLLDAERGLTDIASEFEKAEKCGIECQNYRESLKAQLAAIANMKAYFAPQLP